MMIIVNGQKSYIGRHNTMSYYESTESVPLTTDWLESEDIEPLSDDCSPTFSFLAGDCVKKMKQMLDGSRSV